VAISTPTEPTGSAVNDTTGAMSYTTASFSVTTGGILIIFVWPTGGTNPTEDFSLSTTISGLSFTQRIAVTGWSTVGTPTRAGKMWTGTGGSGSGTITAGTWATNRTGCSIRVVEVASGYNTSTPVVQTPSRAADADPFSGSTLTFSSASNTDNLFIGAVAKAGTQVLVGEGGAWTTIASEGGFGSPNQRTWSQYDLTSPDTTSTWTWASTNQDVFHMGIEIAVAAGAVSLAPDRISRLAGLFDPDPWAVKPWR